MGKAARWFRGIFSGKSSPAADSSPAKGKNKWGFGKSFREKGKRGKQTRGEMSTPLARVSEERNVEAAEWSKRAFTVAAATAAAADAALAAAQASATVVRLTGSGSGRASIRFGGAKRAAAVKIQAAFRGYLARRALKALKALVKLQALVRGNIVRKQAAETLRCMHALVRVQARARACRALRSEIRRPDKSTAHPHLIPQTPEKFELANVVKAKQQCALERNWSTTREDSSKTNRVQATGWNWLDRWMEERYWDRRENQMDDEPDTKILEIDNGKPHLNPKHKSSKRLSLSAVSSDHNSHSFNTLPDTPSAAQKSTPSPSSTHDQSPSQSKSSVTVETGDFVERLQLHSTSSNRYGTTRSGPFTPVKSECARSLFSEYSDHRNYMADTESSRAKTRSQSAPKQRPELEKSGSIKRTPSHGLGQPSSSSLLQCKFTKVYPGSGRLDRLGMPIRV